MKKQIKIASEPKNSNLTSTLAHETRRKVLKYFVIAAIAVFLGMGLSSCSNTNAQGRNVNTPERWEYRVTNIDTGSPKANEAVYNELGRDGWEFVGRGRYDTHLVFKRRLP